MSDLPEAVRKSLEEGVVVASEKDAAATIESYRQQIDADKTAVADTAMSTSDATAASPETPVTHEETAENSAAAESGKEGTEAGKAEAQAKADEGAGD